jgi:transposase
VQSARLWARLLGVEGAVIGRVWYDEQAGAVVVAARPRKHQLGRCGVCGRRCGGFDRGEGRRRWRALDLGTLKAFVEADAPRVRCPEHGVVVVAVPWARHGARHTRGFDDTAAWLAVHTSKQAVGQLLRVAWETVGRVVARVAADAEQAADRFDELRRVGIDEIAYKKGHKYLTVVVDHDTRRLVWAAPGRDAATLGRFFDALGEQRCAGIRLVSADAAEWIAVTVAARCPGATLCADPFHVVKWATDALDEVRREVWNTARKGGDTALAGELKGARYALWKNPEDLTRRQRGKLAWIAQVNNRLYRAYLLKEQLRLVFKLKGVRATVLLEAWLRWARRCRIPAFVKLAKAVTAHRASIQAALTEGLSNGLVESTNTKIRLLTRVAFGFRSPEALIALAMLSVGGLCPPLPGRA